MLQHGVRACTCVQELRDEIQQEFTSPQFELAFLRAAHVSLRLGNRKVDRSRASQKKVACQKKAIFVLGPSASGKSYSIQHGLLSTVARENRWQKNLNFVALDGGLMREVGLAVTTSHLSCLAPLTLSTTPLHRAPQRARAHPPASRVCVCVTVPSSCPTAQVSTMWARIKKLALYAHEQSYTGFVDLHEWFQPESSAMKKRMFQRLVASTVPVIAPQQRLA